MRRTHSSRIFCLAILACAFQLSAHESQAQTDSVAAKSNHESQKIPWKNSLYLAGGWGSPQGFRFDLGYNFGAYFGLGLTFGINDRWSRDPGEGTIGALAQFHYPIESSTFQPYLLLCRGGTIALFGGTDSYTLLYVGAMVPVKSWLAFRPEVGIDFTTKYISGGNSLFGGYSPEVNESTTRVGVHLSMEIDLARVFRSAS